MAGSARTVIRLKGNFFGIPNDIIDKHGRTIGAIGVGVYAALARFADAKTGECWPAIARLERVLGLARSTVKLYLRKLAAAGLIEIEERWADPGDRTSNLYTLLDATPSAVAKRLAAREATNVAGTADQARASEGRPVGDLPSGDQQSTRRLAHAPELTHPEQMQENKAECLRTDERPATPPKNACPHPDADVHRFDSLILCHHCWSLLEESEVVGTSQELHTPRAEICCMPAA